MAGVATQTSGGRQSRGTAGVAKAAFDRVTLEAMIRERAYHLWEAEGRPAGRHDTHWLQAEQELREARPGASNGKSPRANAAAKPARTPGSKATRTPAAGAAGGRGTGTKPDPARIT